MDDPKIKSIDFAVLPRTERLRAQIRGLLSTDCAECEQQRCPKHLSKVLWWSRVLVLGAVVGWMIAQFTSPTTRWISESLCSILALAGTALSLIDRWRFRRKHDEPVA